MKPRLIQSFADEITKVAIAIKGFKPGVDPVWAAIQPKNPGNHPMWRLIMRLRMQGLTPTGSLTPMSRKWLSEIQGIAAQGKLPKTTRLVGGQSGGVRFPTLSLGDEGRGIIPVSTTSGGRVGTGEHEISTFFHPEMRGQKYVDLDRGLSFGGLSPRQVQSVSAKVRNVSKEYKKELRSALKEFSPEEWDNFLKSYRRWETTHRRKEPAWTQAARRRLIEMGELSGPNKKRRR